MSNGESGGFGGLFETARRIQSEMSRVKEELGRKTVTAESGGGLVRASANGRGELLSLAFDAAILPATFSAADRKMLEDLVVGAVNLALERARQEAESELARAASGLPLPPGILGGG